MTANERLEKLLNRAGQTISDLPRKGIEASEPYPLSACPKANGAAWNWYLDIGCDMDDYDSTRTKLVLKQYILHLTDIIDRMEWALENALNEQSSGLTEQDLKDLETLRKVRTGKILKKVCGDFTIINGDFERRMPHYPVVFCQDCKRRLNCLISGGTDAGNCNPYFFCADGEREADE